MFEVLAFVFDNYWCGDACPELPTLHRQLRTAGFDGEQIQEALIWLEELKTSSLALPTALPVGTSTEVNSLAHPNYRLTDPLRVFSHAEQARLGPAGWGFLTFLVSAHVLSWQRLELVMERAMASTAQQLSLEELKLIVLMVFWSVGDEPDALILDELCDSRPNRLAH